MRRMFLSLLVFLSPFAAFADHFGDFYVVPIAGHTQGRNGSLWQTDLIVHNFQDVPVTIEAGLVDSGLATFDNFAAVMVNGAPAFTVPARATRVIADVLQNHRGRETSLGALLVGGDHPFALSTRIHNVAGQSPSVGQVVPVAQEFLSAVGQRAVIPGLIANNDFRSNVGFVAASGSTPFGVEVSLLSSSGQPLGTPHTFTLPSNAIAHIQWSTTQLGAGAFDVATASFRIVSGTGNATGYASIVDNRTNNATFISAGLPGATTSLQRSLFDLVLRGSER